MCVTNVFFVLAHIAAVCMHFYQFVINDEKYIHYMNERSGKQNKSFETNKQIWILQLNYTFSNWIIQFYDYSLLVCVVPFGSEGNAKPHCSSYLIHFFPFAFFLLWQNCSKFRWRRITHIKKWHIRSIEQWCKSSDHHHHHNSHTITKAFAKHQLQQSNKHDKMFAK